MARKSLVSAGPWLPPGMDFQQAGPDQIPAGLFGGAGPTPRVRRERAWTDRASAVVLGEADAQGDQIQVVDQRAEQ